MLLTLEMRTSVRCPECKTLTPLPGLRDRVTCISCTATIDVDAVHKTKFVKGVHFAFSSSRDSVLEALLGNDGDALDLIEFEDTPTAMRRIPAQCTACEALLGPPSASAESIACPKCADAISVRWPDEETRRWDPRLWCVFGDGKDRGGKDRGVAPAKSDATATVIHCAGCGAALNPEGKKRTVICAHCDAPNFLPDALWMKLLPRGEDHRVYLLYQLDDATLADLYASMPQWLNREQRKIALELLLSMKLELTAERAESLDEALDDHQRRTLAKEPLARALFAVWAKSDEESRRSIAAAAQATPPELLLLLARDRLARVRTTVARRAGLSAQLLDALAEDSDAQVRAEIAARPETSPQTLAKLKKDSDEAVREAAKANPSAPASGFFQRLFGD